MAGDTDRQRRPVELEPYFDASPFATLLFAPDLTLLSSNAAHARMSGVPSAALQGRPMFEVFPKNPDHEGPDTEDVIRASVERVVAERAPDEPPIQRHDLPRGDGTFEARYWRMIHSPVVRDGAVVAIRQDSWDVTETIQAAERQMTLQRIASGIAGIAFWQQDVHADTIVRTPEFDVIFGFAVPATDGLDGSLSGAPTPVAPFRERVHPDDVTMIETEIGAMLEGGPGTVRQTEYRVVRPDGEVRRVAVRGELSVGDAGQPIIVGTSLDVTSLRANEARLERLLAEKEVLLGEVNHRVKNSLQLVSSILSLESRQAAEDERARLMSAASRVQAVSAVHASLYHDDDVRAVEFGAHLHAFCTRLGESLGAAERGIALRVETEPVTLAAEKTVPLSLIVNELVTNAFKYAFGDMAPAGAEVSISFGPSHGRLMLKVCDNGSAKGHDSPPQGAPGAVPSGTGLGTRLVTTLARQIDASLTTEQDAGWSTCVMFDA